jgi:predicted transcriptional regulator
MKLKELMTQTVQTTTPDATIYNAASMMRKASVGMLPVLEDQKIVGVLTDRDIVVRGLSQGKVPKKVGDVMTTSIATLSHEADIDEAIRTMAEHKVGRLLLTDSRQHLVGVVSATDIAHAHEKAQELQGLVGELGDAHKSEKKRQQEPLAKA